MSKILKENFLEKPINILWRHSCSQWSKNILLFFRKKIKASFFKIADWTFIKIRFFLLLFLKQTFKFDKITFFPSHFDKHYYWMQSYEFIETQISCRDKKKQRFFALFLAKNGKSVSQIVWTKKPDLQNLRILSPSRISIGSRYSRSYVIR